MRDTIHVVNAAEYWAIATAVAGMRNRPSAHLGPSAFAVFKPTDVLRLIEP
jgi:hypothetical protein